jgi:probable O-glycosylation ligase (exosortase A-associated)
VSVVLALFLIWMTVTTFFALVPPLAWEQLEKVMKIQLMIFVAMMLINTRKRLDILVWTIVASIGFYGVKGGIFTILTGGAHRVRGPANTFIDGNNEIGLALAMTVPLMYYLYRQAKSKIVRVGLLAGMVLTAVAAVGTQSRGALVGMSAMGIMLWLRGRQKLMILLIATASAFAIAQIMPEEWYARMRTIRHHEGDPAVEGRFAAWRAARAIARDHFTGGGFESITAVGRTDAHSIYFEVLGEHGYVGLGLFLLLGLVVWLSASRVGRQAPRRSETAWLADLARMVQVSIVAYASAGAFLGMAYFDYYYNLVLIVVISRVVLEKELAALHLRSASSTAPQPAVGHPSASASSAGAT